MCKTKITAPYDRLDTIYRSAKTLGIDLIKDTEGCAILNDVYFPEWSPTYK